MTDTTTPTDGGRFTDLDALLAERRNARTTPPPVTVRLRGREWDLGAAPPARLALAVAELQRDHGDGHQVPFARLLLLACDLIPAEVLDAWLDEGLDVEELSEIIPAVAGLWFESDRPSAVTVGEVAAAAGPLIGPPPPPQRPDPT